jgi:hypothetical protein
VFSDFGFKSSVESIVGHKWGLSGGGVVGVIEGKFAKGQVNYPIVLLIRTICM